MSSTNQFFTKEEIPDLTELRDETVEEAINKEWMTYGEAGAKEVEEKCAVDPKKKKMTAKQLANLKQFKETDDRSPESKKASVSQLRVPEPKVQSDEEDDSITPAVEFPPEILEPTKLRDILTKDEQKYFVRRWNEYMSEHQRDFNRAEDYDTVVELLLQYIHQYRIYKRMKNAPSLAYDKNVDLVIHNTHNRAGNLRRDLKTRRKDRIESKETKVSQFLGLVRDVSAQGQNKGAVAVIEQRMIQQQEMEADLIKRKMERTNGNN